MLTISILIAATVIIFYLAFIKDRVEIVTGPTEVPKKIPDYILECLEEML